MLKSTEFIICCVETVESTAAFTADKAISARVRPSFLHNATSGIGMTPETIIRNITNTAQPG